MAYIAPLHRPSGVRAAIKLNLSAEEESLVVASVKLICLRIMANKLQ